MEKATVFEFVSYTFEPKKKRIFFNYRQHFKGGEALSFQESVLLPTVPNLAKVDKALLQKLLESLHLILGVSYFKYYCAPKVSHPYQLSLIEANFWNTIYREGLGEFYYRNKLDPQKSPKFSFAKQLQPAPVRLPQTGRFLLGVSGGKDSIVAGELFKEAGIDVTAFFTQTNVQTDLVDKVAQQMGMPLVKIERFLDWQVFSKHAYDGHIPISALYAFLGVFYAVIEGYSAVTVANEFSSNFGNVTYKGFDINHQWSKSSTFEKLFSEYLKAVISPDVLYFSPLRPFYEIRIAKLFAKYKKYFPYFSSCNKNFKLVKEPQSSLWCGQCAKCVFAFTMLSAFLPKKELIGIFKKNLYEQEALLPLFKDILGLGKMKPFDCVGTFEESKTAFLMGATKFQADFIVRQLADKVKVGDKVVKNLFSVQPDSLIPDYLEFIGMENALILGYGKEGKVTEQWLKQEYKNVTVGVGDAALDKDYLKKQTDFDIAVKTPGIKKSLVTIPYTTATNIFFSKIKQSGNLIIGITGSKGKSTTTSLIYAILKQAKKNVSLVGNIGNPMLEVLLRPVKKDEIFVVELSSAQLEDLPYSPNIAVLTNLFPEHMDYHGTLEKYYEAKKHIIRFQNADDIFVSHPELVKLWKKDIRATVLLAGKPVPSQLQGAHNENNVALAVTVARQLGVGESVIKKAVQEFKPLPHRLEYVGTFKGIQFYDDAISTTPESTILALKALKNVDTIFLGGEDRGYDFSQLEKAIKTYKIKNAVVFPNSGSKIKLPGVTVLKTKSMEEAVRFAYQNTQAGKICLLSCASPSYSLWKNFEEKGDQFQTFVKKLAQ